MQRRVSATIHVGLIAIVLLILPAPAEALLRVGVDLRWVPLAVETLEEDGTRVDAKRQLESVGAGARALIGLDQFALGPKFNIARHAFDDAGLNFTQVDINAHLRMRIPTARLAIFTEFGPSMALNIGGMGYNIGFGAEVDVLGWPLVDLNLGLALQYVDVPVGIGAGDTMRNRGVRGMVVVGFDLALHSAD